MLKKTQTEQIEKYFFNEWIKKVSSFTTVKPHFQVKSVYSSNGCKILYIIIQCKKKPFIDWHDE